MNRALAALLTAAALLGLTACGTSKPHKPDAAAQVITARFGCRLGELGIPTGKPDKLGGGIYAYKSTDGGKLARFTVKKAPDGGPLPVPDATTVAMLGTVKDC